MRLRGFYNRIVTCFGWLGKMSFFHLVWFIFTSHLKVDKAACQTATTATCLWCRHNKLPNMKSSQGRKLSIIFLWKSRTERYIKRQQWGKNFRNAAVATQTAMSFHTCPNSKPFNVDQTAPMWKCPKVKLLYNKGWTCGNTSKAQYYWLQWKMFGLDSFHRAEQYGSVMFGTLF